MILSLSSEFVVEVSPDISRVVDGCARGLGVDIGVTTVFTALDRWVLLRSVACVP